MHIENIKCNRTLLQQVVVEYLLIPHATKIQYSSATFLIIKDTTYRNYFFMLQDVSWSFKILSSWMWISMILGHSFSFEDTRLLTKYKKTRKINHGPCKMFNIVSEIFGRVHQTVVATYVIGHRANGFQWDWSLVKAITAVFVTKSRVSFQLFALKPLFYRLGCLEFISGVRIYFLMLINGEENAFYASKAKSRLLREWQIVHWRCDIKRRDTCEQHGLAFQS